MDMKFKSQYKTYCFNETLKQLVVNKVIMDCRFKNSSEKEWKHVVRKREVIRLRNNIVCEW